MSNLPTGTVTFLMTDVEGSTALWEQQPEEMKSSTLRLDGVASDIISKNGGILIKPRGEGDSLFAVFARASDGLKAAVDLQLALGDFPFKVRMGLHTGETELLDDDYYGPVVNRCARLRSIAHGGQILLSQATAAVAAKMLPERASLKDLGPHRLKDLQQPVRVSQVRHPELESGFPLLRSLDALPHNLPLQLTSFVGREREIEAVRQLLERSRLVTLTGSGGSGKTRLSLQVAAELLEEFPDGVWQVDLTPLRDPHLIPKARSLAGSTVTSYVFSKPPTVATSLTPGTPVSW